jgi:serine phosphatase RsbU (regulator of sigma subunit)/putative methionine-R-sulfoxide reductase with GAF domain
MTLQADNLVGIDRLVTRRSLTSFLADTARFYGSGVLVLDPDLEPVARLNEPDFTPADLPIRKVGASYEIDSPRIRPVEVLGHMIGFVCTGPHQEGDDRAAVELARHIATILADFGLKEYELNDLSQEILDSYEEVNLFYSISSAVGTVRDVEAVCTVILEKACEIIRVNRASILLLDEKVGELYVAAAVGMSDEDRKKVRIPTGEGISGQVMKSRTARLVDDVENLPQGMLSGYERYATRSFISVPLLVERGRAGESVAGVDLPDGAVLPDARGKPVGVINMTDKAGGVSFTSGDLKLVTALSHQAAVLIENMRLIELEKELRIARNIQQSLLPEKPPLVTGLELAGACEPAMNVGGDLYDFVWREEDGNLGIVIADVSGHNVASALMMAVARSAIRGELRRTDDPGLVLEQVNEFLYDDLTRAELFLSILCGVYEPERRVLHVANAGHNPALLYRRGEEACRVLDGDGLLVGVLRSVAYPKGEVKLEPGDTVLLYTDGLVEAADGRGEMFGLGRLDEALRRAADRPAAEMLTRLYEDVYRFTDGRTGADDMTVVVLKVRDEQGR